MGTMLTFKDNSLTDFMTKDEMRKKAPYIFADKPTNAAVSERYVFASTETIIDDMAKLGWYPVDCKQQRASKKSNVRSFHMVAFQNPDVKIVREDGFGGQEVECFPRIILTNSHDGFHSFKFMVGLYRLVCSNGIVIATEQFASISVKHINYDFEELRKVVAVAITKVSEQVGVMDEMEATTLTDEQKRSLAVEALKIRANVKDDEKFEVSDDEVNDVLTPVRDEDKGDTLWNVFNVLQEKMITGNYMMTSPTNGKKRKARAIKGAARDLEINQNLFKAAVGYRAAA